MLTQKITQKKHVLSRNLLSSLFIKMFGFLVYKTSKRNEKIVVQLENINSHQAFFPHILMTLHPSLDNNRVSLSPICAFIFYFCPTLRLSPTNSVQVCYTYNRRSSLSPTVGANSSFSQKGGYYSSPPGEGNIEILLILSLPSLFVNPKEE